MVSWKFLKRPPWRTIVPGIGLVLFLLLTYWLWSPGKDIRDGRHDLGHNGIWIQHGWLGDDGWFKRNSKQEKLPQFRSLAKIEALSESFRNHHIRDIYPHLCPSEAGGNIPQVDFKQTESFLEVFKGFRVMPWVGGVLNLQVHLESETWRHNFTNSIVRLLADHTGFAGIHINIEPLPSGDPDFLKLLDELRVALPRNKILSVAAYPPPTRWHPFPDVHWEKTYFREVARRADQLAVMM